MDTVEQSRSRADTAYGTLSESALRALLDRDRSADCVVVSRGNKISRKHFAEMHAECDNAICFCL
ncbi:MAG: hypothetical protein AB8B64_27205 [Granulosicoccus sp.]